MRPLRPGRRQAVVAAAVVAALLSGRLHAAAPDPVTPYPVDWPHRAPWKLNRELLLPETAHIVFLVDVPHGASPIPGALDHLVELATRYGLRPSSWHRLADPAAPRVTWITPPGPIKPLRVYVRLKDGEATSDVHISRDQLDSFHATIEIPSCPAGALPAEDSFVFVRYVGTLGRDFAAASTVVSDASCGGRTFPVMYVAQTRIAQGGPPGFGKDFLEERTLAHEYGHVLGLGSNPSHGCWYSLIPYAGGAHCTHRECAVHVPTAMALLKGQMRDFCAACLHDIEQAREVWRTGTVFPESERLKQPDPAAHVASLKGYNFRAGGEAERLRGFGKAVMPALIGRMPQLSGGNAASSRAFAATLALGIVIDEDALRRPYDGRELAIKDGTKDLSASVLEWWGRESQRFMSGDDWMLPDVLGRQ